MEALNFDHREGRHCDIQRVNMSLPTTYPKISTYSTEQELINSFRTNNIYFLYTFISHFPSPITFPNPI